MTEPQDPGLVIRGAERLFIAVGLLGVGVWAALYLESGWCCALPAGFFALILVLATWSDSRSSQPGKPFTRE